MNSEWMMLFITLLWCTLGYWESNNCKEGEQNWCSYIAEYIQGERLLWKWKLDVQDTWLLIAMISINKKTFAHLWDSASSQDTPSGYETNVGVVLASFPGSCAWAEKKESLGMRLGVVWEWGKLPPLR